MVDRVSATRIATCFQCKKKQFNERQERYSQELKAQRAADRPTYNAPKQGILETNDGYQHHSAHNRVRPKK